jgi:hypothetical protein
MKLILINFIQSYLLVLRFRTSIQLWKVWEKHQNDKNMAMELNFVLEKKNSSILSQKLMFHNDLLSCQQWSPWNSPMINSNSNGDEN